MPSTESDALRHTYQAMVARLAEGPPLDGVRDMFERIALLAAEPTRVVYEEDVVAGLPSIWATPLGCDMGRAIVYVHGGGFGSGSKDGYRKLAAHLAKAAGTRALIPDYRLAPEHTFPSPLEDVRAVYEQLLTRGWTPSNVAFAGDSTGGNVATCALLALKAEGRPMPGALIAFSPVYDLEARGRTLESNAATDAFISREMAVSTAALYLGGHSPTDPLANPLRSDPSGLPPMFLSCGGHEALRDDAERFAALARHAGVDVTLRVGDGMQHVYQYMAGRAPEADAGIAEAGDWLRARLGGDAG